MNTSPQTPVQAGLRIGIATPQANPTVEPELRTLFPPYVNMLVTRSVSSGEPRQRLQDYFDQLERSLESFGGLRLDAFGFACTASSYFLADGVEESTCARLSQRFGYPVITAAAAIEGKLHLLKARTLAIASPYPDWIHEACISHWQRRGFDVVAASTVNPDMGDTVAIYSTNPEFAAAHFVSELKGVKADAILVTGTGMPSLGIISLLESNLGTSVLSSNQCLAFACLEISKSDIPEPGF